MRRLVSLLAALLPLLPVPAVAETVRVRSGDHDGFTRLVIQFDEAEDWVFGRVDGGFEFRPGRDDITYALDGIYQRIGRNRIADVRDLGDGRLFLAVDCACHGVVDELADGRVVLDMVRGPARDPGTGADARLADFEPAAPIQPESPPADQQVREEIFPRRIPLVITGRDAVPPILPVIRLPLAPPGEAPRADAPATPAPDAESPPALPEDSPDAPVEPEIADPVPAPAPDVHARVAQTQAALLEQIARAAAQGLLDADTSEIDRSVAETRPPVEDEPAPLPDVVPSRLPAVPRGHVSIETSIDRAAARGAPKQDKTDDGDACIDPAYFDVPNWGELDETGADIGAYRSRIVGEFDIADGRGVTALARNYIYITFGAEALALMRRYPDEVERPDLLRAMAEIVDEGQSAVAPALVDQMACAEATALWATLAQPELHNSQSINRQDIVLAFGALPPHLRHHLGPGLADKFLAIGDRATAVLIRAAIDRAAGEPTSEYDMLSAHLDLEAGDLDRATATLDKVVENGDATLPDALLERVETTLANGEAIAADLVALLDGLAFQHRGTELGRRMTDAGIRARASAGELAEAFAQFDDATETGALPPERQAMVEQELFDRLARDADDVGFLRLTIERLDRAATLPTRSRQQTATRLLDLGFQRPARRVLDAQGAVPDPESRRLFARAALMDSRPDVAIGYLAGLEDEQARRLRGQAMEMAKDHPAAVRIFGEIGDPAAGLRAAWRGGLWSDVAELDQGAEGAAARLMVGGPGDATLPGAAETGAPEIGNVDGVSPNEVPPGTRPTADRPVSLAAGQALIDESRATRDTLRALLEELPTPSQDPAAVTAPGS